MASDSVTIMNMTVEDIKDEICEAIDEQKVIKFLYKGQPRIAEPYICGVSAAGKYIMLSFQTGGYSSTNKFGWKLFEIANISAVFVTEDDFNIAGAERLRYDPVDKRFKKTFCAVPKS